jgi:hypothetical protein
VIKLDGKNLIDRAAFVISRTDTDREQLLFYINQGIKTELQDITLTRFSESREMDAANLIAIPSLKNVKTVIWNGEENKQTLEKLYSIIEANSLYDSLTAVGVPVHYVWENQSLRIIPSPPGNTDKITVIGEFWPDDLQDSIASTNLFSTEIPLALAYIGAAEYLDFLQEEQRGQYWLQKGRYILGKWLSGIVGQNVTAVDMLRRDPLGNLGVNPKKRTTIAGTFRNDYGVWDG